MLRHVWRQSERGRERETERERDREREKEKVRFTARTHGGKN